MMDLVMALMLAFGFYDVSSCSVQGYAVRVRESDAVTFTRVDSCQGVQHDPEGASLVLYSPTIWVRILIPPDQHRRRVQYHWGSKMAHIGPDSTPIEWGHIEKG